jgi:cell division protein FtsN
MLRLVVLVLLLANLVYYAWTAGHLRELVPISPTQREPERLARQVRPDLLQLDSGPAAAPAPAPAPQPSAPAPAPSPSATPASTALAGSARSCLEIGPYTEAEYTGVQAVFATALEGVDWTARREERGGVFLVYLGRYASREALLRRQDELRQAGIRSDEIRSSPELEPGLSLGRFTSREQAERRALELADRGVRAARVITITPAAVRVQVRIPAASAELQGRLEALAPRLMGRRPAACANGTGV